MTQAILADAHTQPSATAPPIKPRLWVYTNFDCNLGCSYCLSSSSPSALRRELPLDAYKRLIDDAFAAGITEVFLTGGEPFLLPDILERIEYAAEGARVTVLTNALLLRGRRLEGLRRLKGGNLSLQVSLDGHTAELHDAYRGKGTWVRTVASIRRLLSEGFHVTIGATETPVNAGCEAQLRRFVEDLGVRGEDFILRPLTRNGLSSQGLELTPQDVVPELTVTLDGVFWHPQSGGAANLLTRTISPLQPALDLLKATYSRFLAGGPVPQVYRCA